MQPRIPLRSTGVDVLSLPLSTLEGFVLSLVDGRASVKDISVITGIDDTRLDQILARLSELRAVDLPWAPRKEPKKPPTPIAPDLHFAEMTPRYDKSELDQPSVLAPALRKRILDAFYALEGLDHYEALGVAANAEKEQIRAAYFELSKVFHPDSQFGKDLGAYRTKMEAVFKRLTEAYDVLGKRKRRAEYDEYLAATEQTRTARRKLAQAERSAQKVRESQVPDVSLLDDDTKNALKPPAVPRFDVGAQAPASEPAQARSLRPAPSNEERRARVRERLRQRLKAPSQPGPPPSSRPPAEQDAGSRRKSVIEGLRKSIHASASITHETRLRIESHQRKARDAEQASDVLTAASELQLALALAPDDVSLQNEYARVSKVVARNLAANYEKQAQYEEKVGNWKAAALSWGRVSDHREDDSEAARKAAEALLKSSGDLHRAQKYAQRAAKVGGENVQNLTLLGRVYLAAGLKLNAARELDKAAKLDPRDQMVNNLLREARS